jgi:acyl carrier protein
VQRLPPYVFDDTSRFWFDGPIASAHQRAQGGQVLSAAPDVEQADTEQPHDNAENDVLALIADVGNYAVTALGRSKRLADDLGYDSLLQLRLLDRLRTEYPELQRVDVAEVLPRIGSVGDLVDFVVHQLDKTA